MISCPVGMRIADCTYIEGIPSEIRDSKKNLKRGTEFYIIAGSRIKHRRIIGYEGKMKASFCN